ncbi:endo-1,4-beta-xylanase 2-like [Salvia hispanica]|uniref:endo-1,4-beta-xylanase 2-like n=1 Tax=Salvia hispanica TaxID=49212 RepID=UPI002009BC97|nr:endo-1,4-beta-xylanase 2-like [Salvia hispanica]
MIRFRNSDLVGMQHLKPYKYLNFFLVAVEQPYPAAICGGVNNMEKQAMPMGLFFTEKLNHKSCNQCSEAAAKLAPNIIMNHDFSGGLHHWRPNRCAAYVTSEETAYPRGKSAKLNGRFAVVANRKECWQGLERDISNRVTAGSIYTICAWVGASSLQGAADVLATLRLESNFSAVSYKFIAKASASTDHWEKLEGTFSLPTLPRRVILYLEGPSPGIDLFIRSVVVSCNFSSQPDKLNHKPGTNQCSEAAAAAKPAPNIIINHDFSGGLHHWRPNRCTAYVTSELTAHPRGLSGHFAVVVNRKECWQGLEQDITNRISAGSIYTICAWVGVSSLQGATDVLATLRLENNYFSVSYKFIAKASASTDHWEKLEGTFSLPILPCRVILYLEGPSPGIDLFIRSVVVR